jgi:hypothetical protein
MLKVRKFTNLQLSNFTASYALWYEGGGEWGHMGDYTYIHLRISISIYIYGHEKFRDFEPQ